MHARAQITQTTPQPFFAAVAGDFAKPVVGIDNFSGGVGDADDGVLVQRKFLLCQRAPGRLTFTHQCRRLVHHVYQMLNFHRGTVNGQMGCLARAGTHGLHGFTQPYQSAQPARQRQAYQQQSQQQTRNSPAQGQQ